MNFDNIIGNFQISGIVEQSSFRTVLKDANIENEIVQLLSNIDPIKGTTIISSILLYPELQSNCLRIEALIHIVLGYANGKNKLPVKLIPKLFDLLSNTRFDFHEDPAEDIFVSNVIYKNNNFRIYEGIWENSTFFLQRFLDILETFPNTEFFNKIERSVNSLLMLSEKIAERMHHDAFIVGQEEPLKKFPSSILENINTLKKNLEFKKDEILKLGIDLNDLNKFVLSLENMEEISSADFGKSPLERYPLIFDGNKYIVILPTAISVSIRKFIIDILVSNGYEKPLNQFLTFTYQKHFQSIQVLGEFIDIPILFDRRGKRGLFIAELIKAIDVGRFIHLFFFLDDFEQYSESWISNPSPKIKKIGKQISNNIRNKIKNLKKQKGFKDGITLVVGCGWGRPFQYEVSVKSTDSWKVEHISAPDLSTLSQVSKFKVLTLWKLLESKYKLEGQGVKLVNPNGLLNLYSWAESHNYHLIPHEYFLDKEIDRSHETNIIIRQNSLIDLRKKVLSKWEQHVVIDINNQPISVKRLSIDWYFEDDFKLPIYVSVDDLKAKQLKSLIKDTEINIWYSIKSNSLNKKLIYNLWSGFSIWLAYSISTFKKYFINIPKKISFILEFSSFEFNTIKKSTIDEYNLKNQIEINQTSHSEIVIKIDSTYTQVFYSEINTGERLIVRSFIIGLEKITSISFDELTREKILNEIIPDNSSKHIHIFETKDFRDFILEKLPKPILIDKFDDATIRIGLGFIGNCRNHNSHLIGIEKCTKFLNDLVEELLKIIIVNLKKFNRIKTIEKLLLNHESVAVEKEHWYRTIRSTLSMHKNKNNVIKVTNEQIFKFNAALLSSRIVIEVASCECPVNGGEEPGEIEISKLLTYASLVYHFGNYSDAIKYELMESEIKISPFGDILMHHSFLDNILKPYGNYIEKINLINRSENYEKLYEPQKTSMSVENNFQKEFIEAWNDEFGFSIDNGRAFIDELEDYAVKRIEPIFKISYTELVNLYSSNSNCPIEKAGIIISNFTLFTRNKWDTISGNFKPIDLWPWRFKRRLSLLCKPLINFDNSQDKIYFIASGIIRDSYQYVLNGCYSGSFDENHFISKKMISWIGARKNSIGHEFNKMVADRLFELGWNTNNDVPVTKVLNKKLDKNYGDIDVLAWREKDSRILCIECKDLEFAKTHGEIAKQIYEFKGQYRKNGKPDRLRKHLDRIEVLNNNIEAFAKYLNKKNTFKIITCLVFSKVVPLAFHNDDILRGVKVLSYDGLNVLK